MSFDVFALPLILPRRMEYPASWVGHWPFAYWLMHALRPNQTVELGTHSGNSFFAFCQSAEAHNLAVKVTAVDTWQGDRHAGYYGERVYAQVKEHASMYYPQIAELKRMTFDAARQDFSDRSIDLLHIDGLHTYEAIRHDFETWQSACNQDALVLFHDTQVFNDDFGVWRFWQEQKNQYPYFEFQHSHGLGLICLGDTRSLPLAVQNLFKAKGQSLELVIQEHFANWGQLLIERTESEHLRYHHSLELAQTKIALQQSLVRENAIINSLSWKLTAPLRSLKALFKRLVVKDLI